MLRKLLCDYKAEMTKFQIKQTYNVIYNVIYHFHLKTSCIEFCWHGCVIVLFFPLTTLQLF